MQPVEAANLREAAVYGMAVPCDARLTGRRGEAGRGAPRCEGGTGEEKMWCACTTPHRAGALAAHPVDPTDTVTSSAPRVERLERGEIRCHHDVIL